MCKKCEAIALRYAAELSLMQSDEIRIHVYQKRDRTRQRDYLRGAKETALRIAEAIKNDCIATTSAVTSNGDHS